MVMVFTSDVHCVGIRVGLQSLEKGSVLRGRADLPRRSKIPLQMAR